MATNVTQCIYCEDDGGSLLYRDALLRVVLTDEPFTGFCRVIWNEHITEFSDLLKEERYHCVDVLSVTEMILREILMPIKINIASLGNVTPHLHWHVIPRFADDTHFPQPIWGVAQRLTQARRLPAQFGDQFAVTMNAKMKEDNQK
ncbi:MAG: HIT family protein [Burkholderiales bacterium]|jgi:diadenosine tetraphosphate (Ap4A) HIT family hydrolase|nr:HIT family protein [Burkholderiales bacterium]